MDQQNPLYDLSIHIDMFERVEFALKLKLKNTRWFELESVDKKFLLTVKLLIT